MPSIINTYRIRMSIGYTLIYDLAHIFRAFFLFRAPGTFRPNLFPPEVSLLLFLFWPGPKACVGLFAYSSAGLDGRAAPNPV